MLKYWVRREWTQWFWENLKTIRANTQPKNGNRNISSFDAYNLGGPRCAKMANIWGRTKGVLMGLNGNAFCIISNVEQQRFLWHSKIYSRRIHPWKSVFYYYSCALICLIILVLFRHCFFIIVFFSFIFSTYVWLSILLFCCIIHRTLNCTNHKSVVFQYLFRIKITSTPAMAASSNHSIVSFSSSTVATLLLPSTHTKNTKNS